MWIRTSRIAVNGENPNYTPAILRRAVERLAAVANPLRELYVVLAVCCGGRLLNSWDEWLPRHLSVCGWSDEVDIGITVTAAELLLDYVNGNVGLRERTALKGCSIHELLKQVCTVPRGVRPKCAERSEGSMPPPCEGCVECNGKQGWRGAEFQFLDASAFGARAPRLARPPRLSSHSAEFVASEIVQEPPNPSSIDVDYKPPEDLF
jgi:hypothetical protein